MKVRSRKLRSVVMLGVLSALALCGVARGQAPKPDYSALMRQMRILQAVIDEAMAQTFALPFGLLQKTKGTYLPDFGVVFSLEVNLYPVRIPNPFDARPLSKEELEKAHKAKVERIEIIKDSIPRLLADHASSLREVGPQGSVAVVVHLFHFQAEEERLPTQLVIEVKKEDLLQYWEKKLSYDELLPKMRVLEL
jgi:hypothetical protein